MDIAVNNEALEDGRNKYYITLTLNENTTKVRFSCVVSGAYSTNMNKVFGTYTVTKL